MSKPLTKLSFPLCRHTPTEVLTAPTNTPPSLLLWWSLSVCKIFPFSKAAKFDNSQRVSLR
jgi:hypothetical protein